MTVAKCDITGCPNPSHLYMVALGKTLCTYHVDLQNTATRLGGKTAGWSRPKEPIKDDSAKIRYDLIPPFALEELAKVLTYGAKKYAPDNWKAGDGLPYRRLFGATCRHLWLWFRGIDIDPESGLHHLAHAACCLFFLVEYSYIGVGKDDRPTNKPRIEQSETTP